MCGHPTQVAPSLHHSVQSWDQTRREKPTAARGHSQCFLGRQLNGSKPRAVQYQIRAVALSRDNSASQATWAMSGDIPVVTTGRGEGRSGRRGLLASRGRGCSTCRLAHWPPAQRIIRARMPSVLRLRSPELEHVEAKAVLGRVVPITKHTGTRLRACAVPAVPNECRAREIQSEAGS